MRFKERLSAVASRAGERIYSVTETLVTGIPLAARFAGGIASGALRVAGGAVSKSIEIARSAAQAAGKFVDERGVPAAKRFGDWFTPRASQAARSIASAARDVVGTVVTGFIPAAIRFGGRIAIGALRTSARKAARAVWLVLLVALLVFQPLWILMGFMGDAFFRPHNLFPILMVVWVITIGVIWLSRRGQQAQ